ncbi:FAD-dependent oxidoreductase [Novosphingobium sp. TH158]|uniref:oxidoreductase n=1 Tax=Novosphingobium sp. TH158 TaxID=2067455 RepID=UPI0020B14770|nr:FAD-dependent oxidoreductase [Novosphingobium sp. TH158]
MTALRHLLSPGRIGSLEIRNRLMQSAMGTNLAEPGGFFGDELVAYYEARARGGVGLIITEAVAVGWPQGAALFNQIGISDDKYIPGLARLAGAVKQHGARIALQLHFAGINAARDMIDGRDVWVPSMPLPPKGRGFQGALYPDERALTQAARITSPPRFREIGPEEIAQLVEWFAAGALRAKQAGFDAVEIHGGHGYIIAGFLSRGSNRRTDDYGGSLENRARLLREVTEAVRARVGPDYPVWCKLDSVEFFTDNGLTSEEACYFAQVAEAAGADAITASANHDISVARGLTSSYLPHEPAKLIPYAAAIKAAVKIPVIAVGRIDPERADQAIGEGKFDFMAMGRKQLADPDFAKNLAAGGKAAVRPCIVCYTCFSKAMMASPLRCAVNADLGYERANLLAPATEPKRVVVVGGGPGGMEAARRLTLRGHKVVLLEAGSELGGTARIAAIAYEPNGEFVAWLKRELRRQGVDVRLNNRADVETIRRLSPDAVVVATGAIRRAPDIAGKELPHVHDGQSLRAMLLGEEAAGAAGKAGLASRLALGAARTLGITSSPDAVRKASRLWMPIGKQVVIIGGELVGIELAEFLHDRGRAVTVVDDLEQLGRGLSPARRAVLLDEMPLHGIAFHAGASNIRIEGKTVALTDNGGTAQTLPADTVIIAKGAEPDTALHDELAKAGFATHMVGDCRGVGYIIGAVRSAADVAAII